MNQPKGNWPDPSGPTALPGQAAALPGQAGALPGQAAALPGQAGALPGQAAALPGQAGAADDPNLPDQALASENAAVEHQVERRLASSTFSSGLSVAGYGACLELGMEPVGLVQGFCAMRYVSYGSGYWSYFGSGTGGLYRQWACPHGFVSAEHRTFGYNAEMLVNERSWADGYSAAYNRMLDEAREAGAHGVIGVTHSFRTLIDSNIREFHLTGTAVRIGDLPKPTTPFATFLAGQRLVKLIEAGYMPVSVVASLAEVAVYGYCITEALLSGAYYGQGLGGGFPSGIVGGGGLVGLGAGIARMGPLGMGGFGGGFSPGSSGWSSGPFGTMAQAGGRWTGQVGAGSGGWGTTGSYEPIEVEQVSEAYRSAYQIAEEGAARQLAGDSLHGASMSFSTHEMGEADRVVTCFLQGNRVRRFADPEPLPAPKAVVGLWD